MEFIEGEIYHIYNRGNNRQRIFFNRENYLFFLRKIRKELLPFCDILSYCLMPNHFHLIVYIHPVTHNLNKKHNFNNAIGILLRSYTRAVQKQENSCGSLFQQKTKAKKIEDRSINHTLNYLSICMHYIHQNPFRAGLTDELHDWEFSSYKDYAGLRNGSLCNKALAFMLSGIEENRFIEESYEMISEI